MAKITRICEKCGKIDVITQKTINPEHCRSCSIQIRKQERAANQAAIEAFDIHKPVDSVVIQQISANSVLITAYQGNGKAQIRYFMDRIRYILDRLQTVKSYTIDPLVYDRKQANTPITLTKDTVINGAEVILGV